MAQVSRRHVLYIPGFDPVPARAHRERYRREAAEQARISGDEIVLGKAVEGLRDGWHVEARIEGSEVSVDLEVLAWSDIVRERMRGGILATYCALARTAWIYLGTGALFRLMRLRKGPVMAALYPVVVLLGQAVAAALLGFAGFLVFVFATERLLALIEGESWLMQSHFGVRAWFGMLVAGPGLAWLFLRWCARRDHFFAWYLMKDYAFTSSRRGAWPPELEARMAVFADRIAEALAGEADEVLVVGHSSGAHVAVSVLAGLVRAGRVPEGGPVLALLTLGHVVPMVAFLPRAGRLRADLALLSAQPSAWVDVTAPGDGCCFALCDPVAVSGVAPAGKRWPLVISAAFRQTLSPARLAALRWRPFEAHFQYLNAFDRLPDAPDAYDYFRITAGPRTLADRFATRAPSRSRIERPVNRFTDTAA